MEVTRVKLSELRHDDKNARRHDERNIEEIKRSITAFGQHRPFVVQRGTNKVIVGNGMLDAMLALGMTEGDAYFVDDDDETSIRRALADNRTGELAEWDMTVLQDLMEDLEKSSDKIIGWTESEISDIFTPNTKVSEIETISLRPYKKVHYLITADVNKNDSIISVIEQIKNMDGVEVDSTLN